MSTQGNTTGTTDSMCPACRAEAIWKATGEWASESARTNWMMWGCTCTPKSEADAIAYMNRVTR